MQVHPPSPPFPPQDRLHRFGAYSSLHICCTQNFVIMPKAMYIIYFCLIIIFISPSHSQTLSVCLSLSAHLVPFPQALPHVLLLPAVITPEKEHAEIIAAVGGGTVEPDLVQQLNNIYEEEERSPGNSRDCLRPYISWLRSEVCRGSIKVRRKSILTCKRLKKSTRTFFVFCASAFGLCLVRDKGQTDRTVCRR